MGRIRTELWTFGKAQLTAQVATLADFSLSLLLASVAGMHYLSASFIGALAGGIVNCCMNYRWVFHTNDVKKKNVAVKYMLVWCGSIVLNTLGTFLLTELSGQYFIYAKAVVAVLVAVCWNYQLQRSFVYKNVHIKKGKQLRNNNL